MSREIEFTWTEQDYSLKGFIEKFQHTLPLIVNVTEGWAGIDDEIHTYGSGEVYMISAIKCQDRLLATEKSRNGRCFSIPLTYKHSFTVKRNNQVLGSDLEEIITSCMDYETGLEDLTLGIDRAKNLSFMIGSDRMDNFSRRVTDLAIDSVYEVKYLMANCVNGGTVHPNIQKKDMDTFREIRLVPNELKGCLSIPSYMPLKLSISNGLIGGTKEDYDQVLHNLYQLTKDWNHQKADINKEILLFDEYVQDGNYEYIEPKTWLSITPATAGKLLDATCDRNNPIYSITRESTKQKRPTLFDHVQNADEDVTRMYSSSPELFSKQRLETPDPSKPPTLPPRSNPTVKKKPKAAAPLPQIPHENNPVRKKNISVTRKPYPPIYEETQDQVPPKGAEVFRMPKVTEELPQKSPPLVLKSKYAMPIAYNEKDSDTKIKPVKPTIGINMQLVQNELKENLVNPPEKDKSPPPLLPKPKVSTHKGKIGPPTSTQETIEYTNNIPRGKVRPLASRSVEKRSPPPQREDTPVNITSTKVLAKPVVNEKKNVAQEICSLTSNQLAECLKSLKLGQYAVPFAENDIDGELLASMETKEEMRNMLKESFGMKDLEAHKMWLFVHEGYKRDILNLDVG